MKILLTICILVLTSFAALAQNEGERERLELAAKLNQVNPVSRLIESSILRVGEQWNLSEREKFKREMAAEMDMTNIEKSAVQALADTFTKEELAVMVEYYSKPEAAKIAEKMPIYQRLIQPALTKEIDRALMKLRTGYEAQQKANPAP